MVSSETECVLLRDSWVMCAGRKPCSSLISVDNPESCVVDMLSE